MMPTSATRFTWTRADLEQAAELDQPEGSRPGMRLLISPAALLSLMDFISQRGDRVEMVSAYGDPLACELRFFRRDVP
jgi:hypothetical protein